MGNSTIIFYFQIISYFRIFITPHNWVCTGRTLSIINDYQSYLYQLKWEKVYLNLKFSFLIFTKLKKIPFYILLQIDLKVFWTFQIWPPFDLQWPLVTFYNFWGQNAIEDVGQGYSSPLVHFQIWPPIDLLWPPVTSHDIQG